MSGLVLLVGGARSGKSSLALRLAEEAGDPVVFVATGEARDGEMAERIARHRAERPASFETVEEPLALRAALEAAPPGSCVVVDCLSLWVANLLEAGAGGVEEEAGAAAAAAAARAGRTIAVTNEVGLGIVPATPLGRAYRDVLGRVNAIWAEAADEALLVVAGKVLRLGDA
ncbi:MAG TPA: bifunctional adenosylcobinamide kinase/adenosylcobinamide-phosphate guanylyltransferase [Gaiellaceae bacterium]|nr:bifunctional adenosylcobinamide kinase/adenosylcobinamide-phosphate guanylyltransferase [Gaiellaceae bacterium]